VIRILNKITDAGNMPTLTEIEQTERANTWTELLFGLIPTDRLNDAFLRAYRDHQGLFPIQAKELQAAWENIDREEREAIANQAESEQTRIDRCKYRHQHITDTERAINPSEALVEYRDPLNPTAWIVMPCAECRKSAYEQRLADHKAKHPELTIKPGELANTLVADTIAAQARAARDAATRWRALAILVDADQDPTITFAGRRKLKAIRDYIADPEAYAEAKRRKLELVGSV